MSYEVRAGIPIPKSHRITPVMRRKYPFDDMQPGDFFFVPNREKNTLSTHASNVSRKTGRRFVTRLMFAHETLTDGWQPCEHSHPKAVKGIGVWRVEDPEGTPSENKVIAGLKDAVEGRVKAAKPKAEAKPKKAAPQPVKAAKPKAKKSA